MEQTDFYPKIDIEYLIFPNNIYEDSEKLRNILQQLFLSHIVSISNRI